VRQDREAQVEAVEEVLGHVDPPAVRQMVNRVVEAGIGRKYTVTDRTIAAALDRDGYALTPPLLTPAQCEEVSALFAVDEAFRSTVTMARHRFGEGSYRYFARPLPPIVADLRERLYPPLAAVANRWASRLGMPGYPPDLAGLAAMRAGAGQLRPTPLLLRYEEGGYNCLHQDL
jgi:hypothetical protein